MINELDKQLLENIGFSEKYLKTMSNYVKEKENVETFTKKDIIEILKKTEYDFKYVKGGAYVISKVVENHRFDLSFVISHNLPNIYMYIYKDNELIDRGLRNFSYSLNFLQYDNSLINNRFGFNSIEDLKNFIIDIVEIFNDYVLEFIKEY